MTAAVGVAQENKAPVANPKIYAVNYTVEPLPDSGRIAVTFTVKQPRALLRELRMVPGSRVSGLTGNGELETQDGEITWRPPPSGGTLQWQVAVAHRRNGDGYDAWLGAEWGIFRAEDIIPRATTRTLRGASSRTELVFKLPRRWSVVTQYYGRDNRFRINIRDRRFDQPSGWIVLGRIGVRRDSIAGIRVAVAGPLGQSLRRLDTLALMNWTLPEVVRLLPDTPRRLTIVSAGEPMWRGGLSAPQSLFIHAERPLLSENATSTLLHEIMHLSLGIRSKPGYDWIVEGLAEYYSLELLRRSGTITDKRHAEASADQRSWSRSADALCRPVSTGATTALAVTVFAALNAELEAASTATVSLDDVVRDLASHDARIGLDELQNSVQRIAGDKSDLLHIDKLPGCRNM